MGQYLSRPREVIALSRGEKVHRDRHGQLWLEVGGEVEEFSKDDAQASGLSHWDDMGTTH